MKSLQIISLILIVSVSFILESDAQGGIRFDQMSIRSGISKAKEKGKNLFVDTYAAWCIPCKKMKKVFKDKDVAAYFNDHYVNIKIDMDGPNGKKTYRNYDVVFLPTMMIFDRDGILKYKTDKLLTAQELLNVGVQANVDGVYLGNNASQIISSPIVSTESPPIKEKEAIIEKTNSVEPKPVIKQSKEPEPEPEQNGNGHIVFVLGADDEMPPEVLYEEAYYRLQMMDESYASAALAYLKTQEDWNSKKNVKFIYDFVETTNSMLFDYIKENRDHVASIVGASNLSHSLDILVNQRLYQGFPRPDLDEALELYALINPLTANERAYHYYLNRLLLENKKEEYLSIANSYIDTVDPQDHQIMYKASDIYTTMNYDEDEWNIYFDMIGKAILLNPSDPYYQVTLAKLYLMKGDRKKAKKTVLEAQEIINESSADLNSEIMLILHKINKS